MRRKPADSCRLTAGLLYLFLHSVDCLSVGKLPRPPSEYADLQGELEKLPAMGAPPPQPAPPAGRKPKPVLLE